MATEPIYLPSVESECSNPIITPDHHQGSNYPNPINQLFASQLEQRWKMGTGTVFYRPCAQIRLCSNTFGKPKYVNHICRWRTTKLHCNNREPRTIHIAYSATPKSPNTAVSTFAACSRQSWIPTTGRSRTKTNFLSLRPTQLIDSSII